MNLCQARIDKVQCLSPAGLHRMAYKEWGDPDNPKVLVCVHGLTRVSDDFDRLAQALADEYRVVCPDVVGRGRSDRLRDPKYYVVPQYVSDMVTLLARLDARTVHWLGTSMGGLIGMGLAALPDSPVEKLLLNDVGPVINSGALRRIVAYTRQDVRFASFEEGVQWIREVARSFGPHDDDEWRKLAADVLREDGQGGWVRHYDPGLVVPLTDITPESTQQAEAALWATYDAIRCPTLLVRGSESDLLSAETAEAMRARGPRAELVEIPGVGHAPTFMHADQIEIARRFFLS